MIRVYDELIFERCQLVFPLAREHEVGDALADVARGWPEHQQHQQENNDKLNGEQRPLRHLQLVDAAVGFTLVLRDDGIHAVHEPWLGDQNLMNVGGDAGGECGRGRQHDGRLCLVGNDQLRRGILHDVEVWRDLGKEAHDRRAVVAGQAQRRIALLQSQMRLLPLRYGAEKLVDVGGLCGGVGRHQDRQRRLTEALAQCALQRGNVDDVGVARKLLNVYLHDDLAQDAKHSDDRERQGIAHRQSTGGSALRRRNGPR